MTPFNFLTKIFIFPIYYIFHYNIFFGWIQKKLIKKYYYKKFIFELKNCNFPLPYYSSFIFNTYELNDRKIIQRNLSKKNKCIIVGGGIGFIGVIAYHLTMNPIILFEINEKIIPNLKKNLISNVVKFKIYVGNLMLTKINKKKYFYNHENFLATSMYRSTQKKVKLKNLYYKNISKIKIFNTLIIDGEGVEEHYINYINFLPNIKYLIFEFHNDLFDNKDKINLFKKLNKKNFYLKDSFLNSYFFEKTK
jgi:hypothetical protein